VLIEEAARYADIFTSTRCAQWLTRLQQGVEDTSMAMRVSHLPPNEADIEHALFVIDDGLICATVG